MANQDIFVSFVMLLQISEYNMLIDVSEESATVRFLSRAGDACCEERNGWWGAAPAMKQSQVYPATFGKAEACRS